MYEPFGLNRTEPVPASKLSGDPFGKYFIVREQGDITTGDNYTFYDVSGTKEEMAAFIAAAKMMPNINKEIKDLTGKEIVFVQFTNEATYKQEAVFWVVIVTFIIFIGGVLSSLILWHTDRYDLDTANSLLFVTEGNTIVSGINDPK